jgi:hypothetical protein
MKTIYFVQLVSLVLFSSLAHAGAYRDAVSDCHADGSGILDATSAINSCIASAGSEAAIHFPAGKQFRFTEPIVVNSNYVTLYTDARSATLLSFEGCGDSIIFSKGSTEMFGGGLENFQLRGKANSACAQTAIHAMDTSDFKVLGVTIDSYTSQAGNSIGVYTQGRESLKLFDMHIEANKPIRVGINPNLNRWLDMDHFHFADLHMHAIGGAYHITLDDGVMLSNSTIDGQNAMAGGCGIIKNVSTSAPIEVSYDLKISNIRLEQVVAGCGAPIDLEFTASRPLQTLVIDNVKLGTPSSAGIVLKNVESVSIRNTSYFFGTATAQAPATFIDATGVLYIALDNNKLYQYSQQISAIDPLGAPLTWVAGPWRGKACCTLDPITNTWIRSADSGILGQR